MQKNNFRFDISNYLIHFFRDVDLESGEYILLPEHCGFNNISHQSKIDALYLLRCALRNRKISASWSYRGRKRTIYGKSPAICFTEMPLAAFIQTSEERMKRGENIGQYALMFSKKDMFNIGARPVIYALSGSPARLLHSNMSDEERIIKPELLPIQEQYRYVTYNPSKVDWTHEREWRWAYSGSLTKFNYEIKEYGGVTDIKDSPGLNLDQESFSGAGVIVQNAEDVASIIHDVLVLVDRKDISKDSFKFIISLDTLSSYTNIINPIELSNLFNENLINLDSYINISDSKSREINENITKIINSIIVSYSLTDSVNEFGKSWVWLLDNKSEVTRSLIRSGRVIVNNEGRYLLDVGIPSYSLRDQEEITKQISKELIRQYGVDSDYFSVLNSEYPDNVPFYTDHTDTDHIFYNSTIEVDW